MTASNGINTALTRPGRVFSRPFTHGEICPPSYGGGTSAGGQSVNGVSCGEHRPYGGT